MFIHMCMYHWLPYFWFPFYYTLYYFSMMLQKQEGRNKKNKIRKKERGGVEEGEEGE